MRTRSTSKSSVFHSWISHVGFSDEIEGPTIDYVNDGTSIDDYTITDRFILDMLQWHKQGKKLHIKFVYVILMKTIKYLKTLPNVIDIKMPEGKDDTFRVCGDVHGQVDGNQDYCFLVLRLYQHL